METRRLNTSKWAPNWRSEVGVLQKFCKSFAKVLQMAESKKGLPFPVTPLDRPAERILFGRRDWTRTNDPHHVKVVL